MTKQFTFDSLFLNLCNKLGWFGKKVGKQYMKNGLFNRFIKFGVSSTFIYWVVRAPLLVLFEWLVPSVTIPFLFTIPAYVMSAFVVGVILSLIGFVMNEEWIWKKRR